MPAYVIGEVTVTDPEAYAPYGPLAKASIENHGGRYLVRGGETFECEGEPAGGRVVVLEFETMAAAQAWYASEEYQNALPLRHAASTGRLFFVEGV